MPERWRLIAPSGLSWRQVDEHWLVFDRGASQIHVLDALTAAVLGRLEAGSSDVPALCQSLACDMHGVDQAQLAAAVVQILQDLTTASLIESAGS